MPKKQKAKAQYRALGRKVVIKAQKVEDLYETDSGIIVNDFQIGAETRIGTVVSVGNEVEGLKEGDVVVYSILAYQDLPNGLDASGESAGYVSIDERDVYALVG